MKYLLIGFFCLSIYLSKGQGLVAVPYFNDTVTIAHDFRLGGGTGVNLQPESIEMALFELFEQWNNSDKRSFLESLRDSKEKLQLNDWLFYLLIRKTIQQIFPRESTSTTEVFVYFTLMDLGYDVQLTYLETSVYIYAASAENVYRVPYLTIGDKTFFNLTYVAENEEVTLGIVYLIKGLENGWGKKFSFQMKALPALSPAPTVRPVNFSYRDQSYALELAMDETVKKVLQTFPLLEEKEYFHVPFSRIFNENSIPRLEAAIEGKSITESIELLVTLTRSSFRYGEDYRFFGDSKPMIAEEVFMSSVSDCEDRSALFFGLVKSLLDLPMIVVAYPDHMTVGIALPNYEGGDYLVYRGEKYFICDPTGPADSSTIAEFPSGYGRDAHEVIVHYQPGVD